MENQHDKLDKLKVFSKKMNAPMTVAFAGEGMPLSNGVELAWMNNGWSKGIWANTFQWLNGWHNNVTWINNMGWNNHGWVNSGGSGGGCYITTACVEHAGLLDDCDELTTLRYYRDSLVKEDEAFREKVLEYYEKAPVIVSKINESENRDAILDQLYTDMIKPCVQLLKDGKIGEGKDLYLSFYEKLVAEYLA